MVLAIKQTLTRLTSGELFTTTLFSLILRVSGLALTLVTTVVLTNMLSVGEFGAYAYILATSSMLVLLVVMGCDTLLLRQAVVYVKAKQAALFLGIQIYTLTFVVSLTVLFSVLILLSLPLLTGKMSSVYTDLVGFFLVLIPLGAGLRVLEGFTRGLRAPLSAQIPDQIVRRALFLAFIAVIWAVDSVEPSAANALWFQIFASSLALVAAIVVCRKYYPTLNRTQDKRVEFTNKIWLASSFALAGTTLLQTFVSQLPIVFLGYLSSPESVAQYSVAVRVGTLLNLFIIASNMSIASHVAEFNETSDMLKLRTTATKAARMSFAMALPVGIILFIFAEQVLSVFGEEYADNTLLLRVVVIGYLLHVASGAAAVFLHMTYKEKFTLYVSAVLFIFSLVLSYFMIAAYGVSGAVFAYMTSFLIYKFIVVAIVWFKVGLDTSILGVVKSNPL